MRHRLEDLLVGPVGLPGLLVEVHGRRALALEQRSEIAEQGGLALVAGVEVARERDLVDAQACLASRALQGAQRVAAALVLGHGQRYPLLGPQRQRAVTQLGPEARIGAERRRRAGEYSYEVGELSPTGERALEHGQASLGRGELVVDLKPALLGLHRFAFQSCLLNVSIGQRSSTGSYG